MNTWIKYNPNPAGRMVGDCSIRAIAAALGLTWDESFDEIAQAAKWMADMPSSDAAWGAVLRRAGFYRAIVPNSCPDCYTVADFCREHPRGVYVLKTSGHVVCVIDGRAWDSWDSTGETVIYYFYRRN